MPNKPITQQQLLFELEDLRARLGEAEEALRAIRGGEVDALMVSGVGGEQLFTLKGADYSYRILIEEMGEGALTLSAQGVILYANRRFAEMLKTPLEKMIGATFHTWIAPGSQQLFQSLMGRGAGEKRREQLDLVASDGTRVPVTLSVSNQLIDGMPDSYCLVATDLTEQKRTEEVIVASEKLTRELLAAANQSRRELLSVIEDQKLAEKSLRESEEIFNRFMEFSPIYVFFKDANIRSLRLSKNYEKMLGKPVAKLLGKTMDEVFPSELAKNMIAEDLKIMKEGKEITIEEELDGRIYSTIKFPIFIDGKPRFLAGFAMDITERKRLAEQQAAEYRHIAEINTQLTEANQQLKQAQSQLLQSEKMAAIGNLAAGVAHEINNPIGYVNSNLGTLEKYLADIFAVLNKYETAETLLDQDNPQLEELRQLKKKIDVGYIREDTKALLKESRQGLERVKRIVLDLKNFSRADAEEQWVQADLNQGMEATLNVIWNELKYKCEVVKEYGQLPEIYCLPAQLDQIFLNLLVNASQAIETRGKITIRTGQEGDRVWVEVSDTGKGIPPEDIPHLFEPFFTTKPVGQGTGLGLSVSYSIVEKHHGKIEVHSEVGKGSTFRVWLPVQQPANKEAV